MTAAVEYLLNKASAAETAEHLSCCDANFIPRLSDRVEIHSYADKIVGNAVRFEAWSGGVLVGLVAAYFNDQQNHIAYITSVSVLQAWMGRGIASKLIKKCISHAEASDIQLIELEVGKNNMPAIALYENIGFVAGKYSISSVRMSLLLRRGDEHERQT